MLNPETFESYLRWKELNPIEAARIDWFKSNIFDSDGMHSELLGYLRWCEMNREGK